MHAPKPRTPRKTQSAMRTLCVLPIGMGGEMVESAAATTMMQRVVMKPLRRPMMSASAPKMSCPSTAPTSAAVETIDFSLGMMCQWQWSTPQCCHVREPFGIRKIHAPRLEGNLLPNDCNDYVDDEQVVRVGEKSDALDADALADGEDLGSAADLGRLRLAIGIDLSHRCLRRLAGVRHAGVWRAGRHFLAAFP